MKMLMRNIKIILFIFLITSVALLAGLIFQQYRSKHELNTAAGENKASLVTRYSQAGMIIDNDGLILAQSIAGERRYAEDPLIAMSVLHTVGDYTHNIENTIEGSYQGVLLGNNRNLFRQAILDLFGKGLYGDDITLTISGELSAHAYELLDGRKGSIVVTNYKTGEIIVAVSSPSVSPDSVITYTDIPDTALFNRAMQGAYAPGSTFKVVTAMAFMRSSTYDPSLSIECDGHSTIDPFAAGETGSGHGLVGMKDAIAKSCNVFFGLVGVRTGREQLLKTAERVLYGSSLSVDGLFASGGKIEIPDNQSTLSWISIGQPVADSILYTSPLHMAMLVGSIGNDGIMMKPHVVKYITTPIGEKYALPEMETLTEIVTPEESDVLEQMMTATTEYGTGVYAAVNGYTVASKTGTVQVEGQKNNALCIAYITDSASPYAICVIVEEGGAGGDVAAPLVGDMLSRVTEKYKTS